MTTPPSASRVAAPRRLRAGTVSALAYGGSSSITSYGGENVEFRSPPSAIPSTADASILSRAFSTPQHQILPDPESRAAARFAAITLHITRDCSTNRHDAAPRLSASIPGLLCPRKGPARAHRRYVGPRH